MSTTEYAQNSWRSVPNVENYVEMWNPLVLWKISTPAVSSFRVYPQ